jgi:hypothetical protein
LEEDISEKWLTRVGAKLNIIRSHRKGKGQKYIIVVRSVRVDEFGEL